MTRIDLTPGECITAGWFGLLRYTLSASVPGMTRARAALDRANFLEALDSEVVGVAGEIAMAKHRGTYWEFKVSAVGVHDGDVGRWEVRATRHANGHLPIKKRDDPQRPFALVVGTPPHMDVVGWCWGHEGPELGEWKDEYHQWWVHRSHLRPVPGTVVLSEYGP